MNIFFKRLSLIIVSPLLTTLLFAQSVDEGKKIHIEYVSSKSTYGESVTSYNLLYKAYSNYIQVLNSSSSSAFEKSQCQEELVRIFDDICKAVYYFDRKDPNRQRQFMTAYADIYLHEEMKNAQLNLDDNFYVFVYEVARKYYETKQWELAIHYIEAFINTGVSEKRKEAFRYMGDAYEQLNDYNNATYVYECGLKEFPNDVNLLASLINLLSETKSDDSRLEKYVSHALTLKPNDEGLLYIAAQVCFRNQRYDRSAIYYGKLQRIKPNSTKVVRGLAISNYNQGVLHALADTRNDRARAKQCFNQSTQYFDRLLHNDPLALDYALALANAYAYIGDTENLNKINTQMTQLGYAPVDKAQLVVISEERPKNTRPNGKNLIAKEDFKAPTPQRENGINRVQKNPSQTIRPSDVDLNIPQTGYVNENTFAVIIANEKYEEESQVEYALNDGQIFKTYCKDVLGLPETNIRFRANATLNNILAELDWMRQIASAYGNEATFIFYYAGHGIPDEATGDAYLLPVDGRGSMLATGYSLTKLYEKLGNLPAKRVAVFMDACFSGAKRNGQMLASARGVAIKAKRAVPKGKVVVLSAAQGDETAYPYKEKRHGLFTYYLLKKLQESKGNISMGELADYVIREVKKRSVVVNSKLQTPIITHSVGVDEWRNWSFK